MMIPISQRLTHNEKLHLLVVEGEGEAAVVEEEEGEEEGGVAEAETILPQSGQPHLSLVRFRNMNRALH